MTKETQKQRRDAKKNRQQEFIYINCNKDNTDTAPDPVELKKCY